MNINNYKKNNCSIGEIITAFTNDYINTYNCKNILFARTPTTGGWMDKILENDPRITRILYDTQKHCRRGRRGICNHRYKYNNSTKIVKSEDFANTLSKLDKKFDFVCIDLYHEYTESKRDFNLLLKYLSETGTLVSHDCYPMSKEIAYPTYKSGDWCGETYIAFVELAYLNPILYYGLLNVDTGIGIVSNTNMDFLSNDLDSELQQEFLAIHNDVNKKSNIYEYFCSNSKKLINSIEL